ncbi:MAG: DUF1439 domain-containing protein [Pseudomonadota bacterium]
MLYYQRALPRRQWLAAALCAGMLNLAAAAQPDTQGGEEAEPQTKGPRYTVSAAQLQRSVATRFPLRYPVPGVLSLELQVPQLRLLPEQNRVSAEMVANAAGPALNRSHTGTFEISFALRYEASDRSIRAHQLRFKRLQFPTLQPGVVDMLNTYGPALAQQSLLEVVLHQLRPQDLALAEVMGLQPGSITVTDAGLVIGFVPKPP